MHKASHLAAPSRRGTSTTAERPCSTFAHLERRRRVHRQVRPIGSNRVPSATLITESGLWVLLHVVFYFLLALGLGSLLGSRSVTTVVLLAWMLAVARVLIAVDFLGEARDAVPSAAYQRLAPHAIAGFVGRGGNVPMSAWVAALTLTVWALVALALGSWRTQTRDA